MHALGRKKASSPATEQGPAKGAIPVPHDVGLRERGISEPQDGGKQGSILPTKREKARGQKKQKLPATKRQNIGPGARNTLREATAEEKNKRKNPKKRRSQNEQRRRKGRRTINPAPEKSNVNDGQRLEVPEERKKNARRKKEETGGSSTRSTGKKPVCFEKSPQWRLKGESQRNQEGLH